MPCFAPGLILTEIDLSGRRVLDLPRKMRALYPEAVVAVLTSYDLPEYREAAFSGRGALFHLQIPAPSGPAILAMVAQELSPSSSNLADARKGFHHAPHGTNASGRSKPGGKCPGPGQTRRKRGDRAAIPGSGFKTSGHGGRLPDGQDAIRNRREEMIHTAENDMRLAEGRHPEMIPADTKIAPEEAAAR